MVEQIMNEFIRIHQWLTEIIKRREEDNEAMGQSLKAIKKDFETVADVFKRMETRIIQLEILAGKQLKEELEAPPKKHKLVSNA